MADDFRAWLEREAHKAGLVPPAQPEPQAPPANYLAGWDRFVNAIDQADAPGPGKVAANLLARAVDVPLKATQRFLSGAYDPRSKRTDPAMIADGAAVAGSAMTGGLPFAQKGAVGIFGGKLAKTADKAAMAMAEEMAAKGASRDEIWNATGWFQGADKKWRFEIDDSGATWRGLPGFQASASMKTALGHRPLYDAYPSTAKIAVERKFTPSGSGSFREGLIEEMPSVLSLSDTDLTWAPGKAKSIAHHELQHAVQGAEGFAPGGSHTLSQVEREAAIRDILSWSRPVDEANGIPWQQSWDNAARTVDSPPHRQRLYERLAGEVEARNVQKRMDMSPAQRRATPPWLTQDVPDEQQIVRFSDYLGPQMSMGDKPRFGVIPGGKDRNVIGGDAQTRAAQEAAAEFAPNIDDITHRLNKEAWDNPAAGKLAFDIGSRPLAAQQLAHVKEMLARDERSLEKARGRRSEAIWQESVDKRRAQVAEALAEVNRIDALIREYSRQRKPEA